jgi:hypothetical protein
MARRAAKFVPAIFASVIMSAPLTTVSHAAPAEADTCLSAPKGDTPEGQHWYYRIERGTKRQCWYLREEGDKVSPGTTQNAASSVKPKAKPAASRALADARAEVPMPRLAADQDAAADAPAKSAGQSAGSIGDTAQQTTVATRWPEPTAAAAPASPPQPTAVAPASAQQPIASSSPASPQPAAPVSVAEVRKKQPATAPSATAAPMPLAAADVPSEKPTGSIPTLLLVMLGALALAGLTGSVIYRFAGRRYPLPTNVRSGQRRRVNWETAADGGRAPWIETTPDVEPYSEFTHTEEGREADDALDIDKITEMLERLAKEGPKLNRPISAAGSASYGQS